MIENEEGLVDFGDCQESSYKGMKGIGCQEKHNKNAGPALNKM